MLLTGKSFYWPVIILTVLFLVSSNGKIVLYTGTYPPFSDCTSYTGNNSASIFGAEIELLRSAFSMLNWTEGVNYTFACSGADTATLFSSFQANSDDTVGVMGGIAMAYQRLQNNYEFSQPTTSASLPLIYRKVSQGWYFRRGLDVTTWVILLGTVLAMGASLYLLENRKSAYINMLYNAFCQFFLAPDYPLSNFSSRIANYFSTLLVMIVVIIFTAVSTNIFYNDRNLGDTISLDNLSNQQIYGNEIFANIIADYGVKLVSIDHIDPMMLSEKIDDLDIQYLVVDGPYGDFLTRQRCDLYTATSEIDLIHYGIMFPEGFPRDLNNLISEGITNATNLKTFQEFVTDYYTEKDFGFCGDKIEYQDQVTLYETRGLWFILFAGIGIAVGFFIANLLGSVLKKNLRVYGLQGVRAKMDGKIQRRVATICAIHASISIQSANFLKKLNEEALNDHIQSVKTSIAPQRIAFANNMLHRRYNKLQENKDLNKTPSSKNKLDSFSKVSPLLGWLRSPRKKTRMTSKMDQFDPFSEINHQLSLDSGTNKYSAKREASHDFTANLTSNKTFTPIKIDLKNIDKKQLKNPRRSSFVAQSTKAFRLNQQLHLQLGSFAKSESESNPRSSIPNGEITPKVAVSSADSGYEIGAGERRGSSITIKSVSFLGKMLGKKGMKNNKQINASATAYLAEKEAMLQQELAKKKSEIAHRPSLLLSPQLSPTLNKTSSSPRSKNDTLSPSLFKLKFMHEQTSPSPWGSLADSPIYKIQGVSPKDLKEDANRLDPNYYGRRSQQRLSSKDLGFDTNVHKGSSEIMSSLLSLAIRNHPQHEEDYDYEMQNEQINSRPIPSCDLKAYNFSQVIKTSPSIKLKSKTFDFSEKKKT